MSGWLNSGPSTVWEFAALTVLAMFILLFSVSVAEQKREVRRRRLRKVAENEARLQLALWGSGEWLWEYDVAAANLTCPELLRELGGHDRRSWPIEFLVRRFLHADDQRRLATLRKELDEGLREMHLEVRIGTSGSDYRWLRWRGKVTVVDNEGRALRLTGTCKDVTAQHASDSQLKLGSQVMESVSDAIIVMETNFRIIRVNRSFTAITGYAAEDVVGKSVSGLAAPEDSAMFDRDARPQLEANGYWEGEYWRLRRDGQRFLVRERITCMPGDNDGVAYYVAVFSDITRRKESEEKLHYLANFDTMTGLLNRVALVERLQSAIDTARTTGRMLAVLFLDLDQFKHINDSFGHAIGDDVLRAAASRLSLTLRVEDVVARFGGDEFVVLLTNIGSRENAARVAAKILAAFQSDLEVAGHALATAPSIGISLYPNDGTTSQTLLEHADTAMYQSKKQRPAGYSFYEGEMSLTARSNLYRENQLRHAEQKGELRLHYQPIIDAPSGRINGVEGLIRWHHPDAGLLLPGEFIHLAEERGLINGIGAWALSRACRDVASLNRRLGNELYVSVNVSSLQVRDAGFLECIGRALSDSGLDPPLLRIELTESLIMDASRQVLQVLHELRGYGIQLALDDFGTGYSSLSYLRRFPISNLKIDKSFVRDVPGDSEAASIVTTIIALGHSMRLGITAEGVETLAQSHFLQRQGCREQQGFHFGAPAELAQLEARLANNDIPSNSPERVFEHP